MAESGEAILEFALPHDSASKPTPKLTMVVKTFTILEMEAYVKETTKEIDLVQKIELRVCTLTGASFILHCNRYDTVCQVKENINNYDGTDASSLKLIISGNSAPPKPLFVSLHGVNTQCVRDVLNKWFVKSKGSVQELWEGNKAIIDYGVDSGTVVYALTSEEPGRYLTGEYDAKRAKAAITTSRACVIL